MRGFEVLEARMEKLGGDPNAGVLTGSPDLLRALQKLAQRQQR